MCPNCHLVAQEVPERLLLVDDAAISQDSFFAGHDRMLELEAIADTVEIEVPTCAGFWSKNEKLNSNLLSNELTNVDTVIVDWPERAIHKGSASVIYTGTWRLVVHLVFVILVGDFLK